MRWTGVFSKGKIGEDRQNDGRETEEINKQRNKQISSSPHTTNKSIPHTHTHTHKHKYKPTDLHIYTHRHTYTHTHTDTDKNTRTHTQTQTQTHTRKHNRGTTHWFFHALSKVYWFLTWHLAISARHSYLHEDIKGCRRQSPAAVTNSQ